MRQLLQSSDNQLTEPQVVLYLSILINVGLYNDAIDIADQLLTFTTNRYNRGQILRLMGIAFTGKADDQAAVDAFEEAQMTIQLDYESGLAYGYSLVQLGRIEDAFALIKRHKERFGNRPKIAMLARTADLALQKQRSQSPEVEAP
jgi:tetratricopeptide (TPR) repeat protein